MITQIYLKRDFARKELFTRQCIIFLTRVCFSLADHLPQFVASDLRLSSLLIDGNLSRLYLEANKILDWLDFLLLNLATNISFLLLNSFQFLKRRGPNLVQLCICKLMENLKLSMRMQNLNFQNEDPADFKIILVTLAAYCLRPLAKDQGITRVVVVVVGVGVVVCCSVPFVSFTH